MSNDRIELTVNPEALWDKSVAVTCLTLGGVGLGDPTGNVDQARLIGALPSVGVSPPGFATYVGRWVEGIGFEYFLLRHKRTFHNRKERKERQTGTLWPLEERIRFVMARSGHLLMDDGHYYNVEGRAVTKLGVCAAAVPQIAMFSKRDIVERFGWPDYLWEYDLDDPGVFSTNLLYTRGIHIHFFNEGNRLMYLGLHQDITSQLRPPYVPYTGQPTRLLS